MKKIIKLIVFCSSIFFCINVNAIGIEGFVSAGKIIHDCNQEIDKTLRLLCFSYMIGLRDGLMVGVFENWNRPMDKNLSANTLIVILTKYLNDNPLQSDDMAAVVIARSLEKFEILKRRPQFK